MSNKRLAMFVLAGSITLAGCGSPTAPLTGSAPAAQPAAQPAAAQPAAAKPAANVENTANAQTPAVAAPAQTSGNAAPAAPAQPQGEIGLKGGMGWGGHDFIVFASNRKPGEGKGDIYVFDPAIDTVLAIVGVNTHDNELNPRMSDNGKWLVFQRAWKEGGYGYHRYGKNQDILLYNMDLKLVNTLPALNTEEFDEYSPDVSDDGCNIVYVTEVEKYKPEVRLYDVKTGDNWAIPGLNRNFRDLTWPTISANGKRIAYGASTDKGRYDAEDNDGNETGGDAYTGDPLDFGESNVFVYDIPTGTQLTPPFINTAFDEYNPDLCLDGSRMLFVSNRFGTEDVFEVNLDTGWTDNLSFLNTDELDEQHPRYLGGSVDRIVFQISKKDPSYYSYGYGYGYDFLKLRAYNRATATLDTLPVANHIFADSALRAEQPETNE